MRQCFDAVTVNSARILGLEGYGLEPGCRADFVLLQARDPVEAIRLRATAAAGGARRRVLARTPPSAASPGNLPGRPARWTDAVTGPGPGRAKGASLE
jgi:cytosine deaminase